MKIAIVLGIIMIVLGIYGLLYDTMKNDKEVKITKKQVESTAIPVPAIFGGLSVAGGIGFVIIGIRSEKNVV